jgi:hypothetical protein
MLSQVPLEIFPPPWSVFFGIREIQVVTRGYGCSTVIGQIFAYEILGVDPIPGGLLLLPPD